MKYKVETNKSEKGITLIALIITIIVLVILAAVSIRSIFGSNIIGFATNGAINYAEEQQKELGMLNDVSDLLGDITGDTDRPMSPSITLNGTKGNNDIYTSNVTVEISINRGLEQAGTIKLHYQINGGEEQITEDDVSFEVSEEGTTTITAWAENEKGNLSDKQETSFTINKTAPSNPTIALNGETGDNNYYITDVGVTISAGDASNVSSIKYKVEGANAIAETEVQGTTATFDITTDGTSTITAYIINNAGITSETISQVVNKDTVAPNTATIALSGKAGETSISVTANGEDATSGVASYIFQYSTTNEESGFTTALEVPNTANSCTYTYQDLVSGMTYYLRAIVKDKSGNTTTSIVVTATTKKPLTETELSENIGKYVEYTPVSGSFTSEGQYNGSSNQNFSTISGLKWRILDASSNTLTLISDTVANTNFTLYGENGYNNGVLLLNNACKAMYSKSDWATGRSLNIDDIEKKSDYVGASNAEHRLSDKFYPNIFAQEKTGSVGGTYGTKYDLSDQDEYVKGETKANYFLSGKETYYSYTMTTENMKQIYVMLFSSDTENWLASRCTRYASVNYFYFSMFNVQNSIIGAKYSYYTWDGSYYASKSSMTSNIRPVVEIDLTKVNVGLTGDGGVDTPFSIEAK